MHACMRHNMGDHAYKGKKIEACCQTQNKASCCINNMMCYKPKTPPTWMIPPRESTTIWYGNHFTNCSGCGVYIKAASSGGSAATWDSDSVRGSAAVGLGGRSTVTTSRVIRFNPPRPRMLLLPLQGRRDPTPRSASSGPPADGCVDGGGVRGVRHHHAFRGWDAVDHIAAPVCKRQAPSTKHQASSTKHQAPSVKHQAPRSTKQTNISRQTCMYEYQ